MAPLYHRLLSGCTSLALLASVGVLAGCGVDEPNGEVPETSQATPSSDGPAVLSSDELALSTEPVMIEMGVPDMHCPYGCFPSVKETLEEQPGVLAVELADPKDAEDGSIEDRRVFVKAVKGFDPASTIVALTEAGFKPDSVRMAAGSAASMDGSAVDATSSPQAESNGDGETNAASSADEPTDDENSAAADESDDTAPTLAS